MSCRHRPNRAGQDEFRAALLDCASWLSPPWFPMRSLRISLLASTSCPTPMISSVAWGPCSPRSLPAAPPMNRA